MIKSDLKNFYLFPKLFFVFLSFSFLSLLFSHSFSLLFQLGSRWVYYQSSSSSSSSSHSHSSSTIHITSNIAPITTWIYAFRSKNRIGLGHCVIIVGVVKGTGRLLKVIMPTDPGFLGKIDS